MASLRVAVVLRSGKVLILRRGGAWELPGADELRERLGIEAELGAEAARVPSGGVELVALLVSRFSGEPEPSGGDELAWVEAKRLPELDWVPGQRGLAEALAAHRRRKRYRGTHPRRFSEKYKELRRDSAEMAKAKARGSTPAGAHLPVMVREVVEALEPPAGAAVLDCTLGWGGHAEELARLAGPRGTLIGLDRDAEELARTEERLRGRGASIVARHCDYADALEVVRGMGLDGVHALLADLGASSMQLDRPERGLSFKADGPLDMRMDRSRGKTAAEWLRTASEREIAEALACCGDEPDAAAIAAELARLAAQGRPPKTTGELVAAVGAAKRMAPGRFRKRAASSVHPAARTFQALRIVVNSERESLSRLLRDLPALVRPGGRAVFLTFHRGEEELVEGALREQAARGLWRAPLEPPRRPSPEEVRENPRARSARLWRAVRT